MADLQELVARFGDRGSQALKGVPGALGNAAVKGGPLAHPPPQTLLHFDAFHG